MTKTKQESEKSAQNLLKAISSIEKHGLPYSQFTLSSHPLVDQIIRVSDRVKNPELKNELLESAAKIVLMGALIHSQKCK